MLNTVLAPAKCSNLIYSWYLKYANAFKFYFVAIHRRDPAK